MLSCVCAANTLLFSLSFLLPSPPVLIISHWNYYNLIRYHPSSRPSLAPHCKPTAIIRRVCSLRRRVISRLIYIYIPAYPSLCRALTHLYNVPTTRLPYSSLAQRCAGRYPHLPIRLDLSLPNRSPGFSFQEGFRASCRLRYGPVRYVERR